MSPKPSEKGRWLEITFTHWDGLPTGKEAPVIIITLSEGNPKNPKFPMKELAKATYYYPGDDKAHDFQNLLEQLTPQERQWMYKIVGKWITEE